MCPRNPPLRWVKEVVDGGKYLFPPHHGACLPQWRSTERPSARHARLASVPTRVIVVRLESSSISSHQLASRSQSQQRHPHGPQPPRFALARLR